MNTRIKICGLTNLADALAACAAGADAAGFVFAESPRQVTEETVTEICKQLPPFVVRVGVFVNQPADKVNEIVRDCGLDVAQLHGDEDRSYLDRLCCRAVKCFKVRDGSVLKRIESFKVETFLLDTYVTGVGGGTGKTFDWELAAKAGELGNVILAGGLTPENVAEALSRVRPYGVDVSSGVEKAPGKKDHEKMKALVHEVRLWDYPISEAISVDSADVLSRKR